jgi:monooxygenase
MYTLGYSFRPWEEAKAIADGPSILRYVNDTADMYGIRDHIRFRHQVKSASWSSADARWTVEAELGGSGERVRFSCGWLHMCSGYYNYSEVYDPGFRRQGKLPRQDRPSAILAGGSRLSGQEGGRDRQRRHRGDDRAGDGEGPAHVVMLQRSPTYMVSRPSEDNLANNLRKILPSKLAYGITRWKNVLLQMFFFNLARKRPARVKEQLLEEVKKLLPKAMTSAPISRRATIRGTSGSASCRTPTCSRRSATAAPRSSPARSTASPARA